MSEFVATVERIGARGDGIARHAGKTLFLPFTAPGDVVRILSSKGGADIVERVADGARREPPCPHFGTCGGCSLQHLPDDVYAEAKTALVREALAHRGLDPGVVTPLRRTRPATRRRARLALAKRGTRAVDIGFHAPASHRIVDLLSCLVLHPALTMLVPGLRALGQELLRPGENATAMLTQSAAGIDLLIDLPRPPDLAMSQLLSAFAEIHDLPRLSWRTAKEAPAPIVQRRPVRIFFAGRAVDLPPDCFLQASEEAEEILRDEALAFISGAARVADLFCGVGTFGLALGPDASVRAVDGDPAAIAALQAAARRAGLGDRLIAETRDLERRPLRAEELAPFDAVLFDPPYAGAKAQALELARSKVPRVIGVSCHPASLARDARLLVDGGYRLARVVPVDQFLWSAEIELVAYFER